MNESCGPIDEPENSLESPEAGLMQNLPHDEVDDEQNDEPLICIRCNGSGQGMHDGTTCGECGGKGVERQWVEDEDRWIEDEDRR